METIKLHQELKQTLNYLRIYESEKPNEKMQIVYLTLQANYLMEQIRGRELADRILSN